MITVIVVCMILVSIVSWAMYNRGFRDGVNSITGGMPSELWKAMTETSSPKNNMEIGVKDEPGRRANL